MDEVLLKTLDDYEAAAAVEGRRSGILQATMLFMLALMIGSSLLAEKLSGSAAETVGMFTLGACAVTVIAGIVLVFWREQASMVRREAFDRHMDAARKLVEECFDEVAPET